MIPLRALLAPLVGLIVATSQTTGPDPLLGAVALALDSTVTLIRRLHPNAEPGQGTPIYVREKIFVQDGREVKERRPPHRWLDSTVAALQLTGVCVDKDFTCSRPFTGYLLTLWEPADPTEPVTIQVDVQLVRIERAMLQSFPTYGNQPPTTSPSDRLQMRIISGAAVHAAASQDATGEWHMSRFVAPLL
jgi:hypothetical protein